MCCKPCSKVMTITIYPKVITYLFMKWHFLSSIMMAGFIALIAITDSEKTRYIYVVPTIILFYISLILFAVEYDGLMIKQWKKNEEKIKTKVRKEAYIESFNEYLKKKERSEKNIPI
jgi:hypothetical protein